MQRGNAPRIAVGRSEAPPWHSNETKGREGRRRLSLGKEERWGVWRAKLETRKGREANALSGSSDGRRGRRFQTFLACPGLAVGEREAALVRTGGRTDGSPSFSKTRQTFAAAVRRGQREEGRGAA